MNDRQRRVVAPLFMALCLVAILLVLFDVPRPW
jgi:hypothetical protein